GRDAPGIRLSAPTRRATMGSQVSRRIVRPPGGTRTMAPPTTAADFRARVERSGLLAPAQLDPYFADATDPDDVAGRLVADRLLTPFQARQLNKGRTDGFFL